MKEPKDQFVVAYIRDFERTDAIISYVEALSFILKKGIILLYISDNTSKTIHPEEAEKRLSLLKESVQSEYMVSYIALSGNPKTIISALPEKVGAVCFVTSISDEEQRLKKVRKLLQPFSESRVAYFFAKEPLQDIEDLKKIVFTINFEKQSKEKVLWASYFGRFFQSKIYCLFYTYRDEFLRKRFQDNQMFVAKMLSSFQVQLFFEEVKGRKKWKLDQEALHESEDINAGLFIAIATESKDIFSYLTGGVSEEKLLLKLGKVPVMLLNPRKDLYVLCD